MTSGKAARLKKVADEVACVKCHVNPRFGSLARCKQCLKADAEVERLARERLLPSPVAPKSTRQQATTSSIVTRQTKGLSRDEKALPDTAPVARAKIQTRQPPERLTAKSLKTRLSDWVKRCWGANDLDVQQRIGTRDICSDLIGQTASKIDYVYGGPHGAPHMRVYANGDPHLDVMRSAAEHMWRLPRLGEVVTANGVSDLRTACAFCGARVKVPCTESRARNCANRSRGNR